MPPLQKLFTGASLLEDENWAMFYLRIFDIK
jgi:hypothetical protein